MIAAGISHARKAPSQARLGLCFIQSFQGAGDQGVRRANRA